MGAYLSKPITEKISSDESNKNLACGASSMQGWRVYQEDAHNTCLSFDKNRALFAVYDGHGGSEVATYSASELPDFIKTVEAYENEQFSQALIDAFLEFDATLVENDVQCVLKDLAGRKDDKEEDSDYDGEEVDHLCREASMPLEEVMAKYSEDSPSMHFQSPCIRPKMKVGCMSSAVGCSSSSLDDEFNDDSDLEPVANTSFESSCCSHLNESTSGVTTEEETSVMESPDASPVHSCPHIEEASSSLCNGTSVELKKDVVEKANEESNSTEVDKQEISKIDRVDNKETNSNDVDKKDTSSSNDLDKKETSTSNDLDKKDASPSIKEEISPKLCKEELSPIKNKEEIISKADKRLSSPKDSKVDLSSNSEKENKSNGNSTAVNGSKEPPLVNGKIKDEGGGHTEGEDTKEEKKSSLSSPSEKMDVEIENGANKSKDLNEEVSQKSDSPKGKGKGGKAKGKGLLSNAMVQAMLAVKQNEKKRKAAIIAEQIYKQIKVGRNDSSSDDEDEEDDEDDNFENEKCCHHREDSSTEEDESENEEDDDDDDDDDDSDDEEMKEGVHYTEFPMNMKEEPGYDSGCTACVAFLNGTELFVANVGDSRCVVSRDGKALDMSIDHKPEDEPEAARIRQAGGRITSDGRVNGGLNLSRALGDHSYKQNKAQRPEAQMISPLPDVRSLTLTPDDAFMVIACDGIWNSMTSQDVVDFINERLESHPRLSKIAEELFDYCLSPDAHGDGTGCDNMTCIIIKFKSQFLSSSDGGKRACEATELSTDESSDPQEKRCRLDAE